MVKCSTWFQSTHSLRSATKEYKRMPYTIYSFNPRTPCGVRLDNLAAAVDSGDVSIHALLAECDKSVRWTEETEETVSIHALLAECDCIDMGLPRYDEVSIHALLAECDHIPPLSIPPEQLFQSTHSLRSATCSHATGTYPYEVSIHALLAECDRRLKQ